MLPRPQHLESRAGTLILDASSSLQASGDAVQVANFVAETLRLSTGFELPLQEQNGTLQLHLNPALSHLPAEGYRLEVTEQGVILQATQPAGLFRGTMTLLQLLPAEVFSSEVMAQEWALPCLVIEDWPRFRWRGLMLDVSRHFMPVDFIKKLLDLMALHKLNVFHWHLTDDQGWRLEVRKYPKLTEVGAWRPNTLKGHALHPPFEYDDVPHGGFYTQQQVREVVEHAAARFIEVVPEIEMPGHAQAAIAAYPELGNTGEQLEVCNTWGIMEHVFNPSEATLLFLQDVLTEVMELFPGKYICIGGDECLKKQWQQSPAAQQRMVELGLQNEEQLQSYFVSRMDQFLHQHGRKLLGWDEILEGGLAPHATVLSWRGEEGGMAAARAGHDVVMVPQTHLYLDHYQTEHPELEPLAIGGKNTLERVYHYNPVGWATQQEAQFVLGTQGNLWTEYVKTPQDAERMLFPRVCALSEMAWTLPEHHDFQDFAQRLVFHLQRLDVLQVNHHKAATLHSQQS